MPTWNFCRGTLHPFTQNGQDIVQRLLDNQNTHNWLGNSAPVELQVVENSLPIKDKEAWIQKESEYTGDFSSSEYDSYLLEQYGYKSSFTRLTFDVKWGASSAETSGDTRKMKFSFSTPYGAPMEFFQYLQRNGIDIEVSSNNYELNTIDESLL